MHIFDLEVGNMEKQTQQGADILLTRGAAEASVAHEKGLEGL